MIQNVHTNDVDNDDNSNKIDYDIVDDGYNNATAMITSATTTTITMKTMTISMTIPTNTTTTAMKIITTK